MKLYSLNDLNTYMENDWILQLMKKNGSTEEDSIRTNQWLMEMGNKRMIYADMYGDLLLNKKNVRVLDVGGGYNALTKALAKNCEYTLLDFDAHGNNTCFSNEKSELSLFTQRYAIKCIIKDWYTCYLDESYDIIIANDIFPDVDQRLELFINRYLGKCKEMRLMLTFYNTPKFYTTKRIDDTELLTFLSWDGEILALKLSKFADYFIDTTIEQLQELITTKDSIFRNGRHCVYLQLSGNK